jgi:hypothetical protein
MGIFMHSDSTVRPLGDTSLAERAVLSDNPAARQVHPNRPQLRLVTANPGVRILAAPGRERTDRRFSVRDRMEVAAWRLDAAEAGYGRVVVDHASGVDDDERGEYLLIYERDNDWARWGIGCRADGYLLWDAIRGTTIGVYPALRQALAEVLQG